MKYKDVTSASLLISVFFSEHHEQKWALLSEILNWNMKAAFIQKEQ